MDQMNVLNKMVQDPDYLSSDYTSKDFSQSSNQAGGAGVPRGAAGQQRRVHWGGVGVDRDAWAFAWAANGPALTCVLRRPEENGLCYLMVDASIGFLNGC